MRGLAETGARAFDVERRLGGSRPEGRVQRGVENRVARSSTASRMNGTVRTTLRCDLEERDVCIARDTIPSTVLSTGTARVLNLLTWKEWVAMEESGFVTIGRKAFYDWQDCTTVHACFRAIHLTFLFFK